MGRLACDGWGGREEDLAVLSSDPGRLTVRHPKPPAIMRDPTPCKRGLDSAIAESHQRASIERLLCLHDLARDDSLVQKQRALHL